MQIIIEDKASLKKIEKIENACVKKFGKNKFSLIGQIGIDKQNGTNKKRLGIVFYAIALNEKLKKEVSKSIDAKFNQSLQIEFFEL